MENRRGEFNFVWLFALIVGAAILVFAIYGAVKFSDTERYQTDTEVAKTLSIITDPMQAGFAEGSSSVIRFREEARIDNFCVSGEFGRNDISVATRSGVGEEWKKGGVPVSVVNKYIFSNFEEGKDFYIFSKGFNFPYEVSDLIFLSSESFCLVNAPEKIEEEISSLNMKNLELDGNCTNGSTRVCFGFGAGCDVEVEGQCLDCENPYEFGRVKKDGKSFDYVGSLVYGAIVSGKDVYDCNVKRLLYRAGLIAEVLARKADLAAGRGCGSNVVGDLDIFSSMLKSAEVSDIKNLYDFALYIENKEKQEACDLF